MTFYRYASQAATTTGSRKMRAIKVAKGQKQVLVRFKPPKITAGTLNGHSLMVVKRRKVARALVSSIPDIDYIQDDERGEDMHLFNGGSTIIAVNSTETANTSSTHRDCVLPVDPAAPLGERSSEIGAVPGMRLNDVQAGTVMKHIHKQFVDVADTPGAARKMLSTTDFDGTGLTAEQLVREGRTVRVLSRLDDLRYGVRG